jgi:hypothetical protein
MIEIQGLTKSYRTSSQRIYLSKDGIEVHEDINTAIAKYENTSKKTVVILKNSLFRSSGDVN